MNSVDGKTTYATGRLVASIGAYDRFNYGDLLFPLVLNHVAESSGHPPLQHFSPRRSALVDLGAVRTGSLADLEKLRKRAESFAVVLGGGEVGGADWSQALITAAPVPADLVLIALRRLAPSSALDLLGRALFRSSWPTPYFPTVSAVSQHPAAASAIGVSSISMLNSRIRAEVISALRQFRFISVRDLDGQRALAQYGLHAELAPDSVSILPELRPGLSPNPDGPLVVQVARHWMRRRGIQLVQALSELSREYSEIVLLPIGLAGGHGDYVALQKVRRALSPNTNAPIRVINPTSVWEIAETIASAKLFVGTSLHGTITALATATPFVPLAGVPKLDSYIGTWAREMARISVEPENLIESARHALGTAPDARQALSESLHAKSLANTQRVLDSVYS